jgi:IgA Peptidase M64
MRLRFAAFAAVSLVAALSAPSALAQAVGSATVVPMQITGPPAERLNLVILGDGYQAQELDEFRADVDRNLNVQWSIEPFRSYRPTSTSTGWRSSRRTPASAVIRTTAT